MSFTIRLMAASAVALGLVATPVLAQDARAIRAAEQVRDQALKGNIALDYVTQITTRFGPRPAGSRAEQDAAANVFVLDDVTPRYAAASTALKACDTGLGMALDRLREPDAPARFLN